MEQLDHGYWSLTVEGAPHGTLYRYRLDGDTERADPASYCQPRGVHGPSMVIDHTRSSEHDRSTAGISLDNYVIYELHVGTFTAEGTFESASLHIAELASLGITAIEIMPVAHFPGERNWGYDGVYPFAVHTAYGGVEGLTMFVDTCHAHGIAVVLDVVYNHLGPEGNYLRDFGPYFSSAYHTPWGESINFDGPHSDEVTAYFIENACYWFREFSIDALRLDAIHAICDMGARPFLQRLSETIAQRFGSDPVPRYLIAESDLNDGNVILDRAQYGLGMHAQWSDDLHHALHAVLTGEQKGYYLDFGSVEDVADAYRRTFVYNGRYSSFRNRSHGNCVASYPTGKFVVSSQNHDQVGNRMRGERLLSITDFEKAQCAAAAVLLSPFIPLIFMGEEHAETAPFLYFADHGDEALVTAVREGRKREFAGFFDGEEPPDPFCSETFQRSSIDWRRRESHEGATMLRLYKDCLALRKERIVGCASRENISIHQQDENNIIMIEYRCASCTSLCMLHFGDTNASLTLPGHREWRKRLDSGLYRLSPCDSTLPDHIDNSTSALALTPFAFAVYTSEESL